jgi:lipopolysaccharide export system protein LptA
LATFLIAGGALAERADRSKPIQVDADQLNVDEAKQVSTFAGNVHLTQGTLLLRADKLVVKQEGGGFQSAIAYGNPAQFREKLEGGKEYLEGWAERIEYEGRANKVQFFGNARLKRGQDEVQGNYIAYDGKTEVFHASGGKDTTGRVRAIIQPKSQESSSSPRPAAGARGG